VSLTPEQEEILRVAIKAAYDKGYESCEAEHEAKALAAFQRYKEEKWLDVPANTLNELLHLIQTKEYQRGFNDGAESMYDTNSED
jgi:hypothetical protein